MFSNKYFSNQAQNNENVARSMANKPAVAPRRRALGDITNSYADEEHRDVVTKRPQVVAPAQEPMHEDAASVMSDRSYMQRPCDDIDSRDADNPLLVTCYANEMYDHFNQLELDYRVNPNYIRMRQEVVTEKMRCILIDWLVEVHLKFKMVPETIYITVQIIDRYLQVRAVRRSKLQLVGVAALLVAAKYEEIYPPELRELVFITDQAYSKAEILEMEADILRTLDYKLTVPTIHTFLCRYLKAAHADRTMVQLSCFLTERSLQEYGMLKFTPSQIAATAVLIARKSLNRHPWSPTLLKYTKYDELDLVGCAEELRIALNDITCLQQAVKRKYSSSKFGAVAKMTLSF